MADSAAALPAFVGVLKAIAESKKESFWFRIVDHDDDRPECFELPPADEKAKDKKEREEAERPVRQRETLSLRKAIGILQDQHLNILKGSKSIVDKKMRHGMTQQFKQSTFEKLLRDNGFTDFELEPAKIAGTTRYYLRLGHKCDGYYTSAQQQIEAGVYEPPMYRIRSEQNQLERVLLRNDPASDDTSGDSSGDDSDSGNGDGRATDEKDDEGNDTGEPKKLNANSYSVLRSMGIDVSALNPRQVKMLIGELVNLQRYLQEQSTKADGTIDATNNEEERQTIQCRNLLTILQHIV